MIPQTLLWYFKDAIKVTYWKKKGRTITQRQLSLFFLIYLLEKLKHIPAFLLSLFPLVYKRRNQSIHTVLHLGFFSHLTIYFRGISISAHFFLMVALQPYSGCITANQFCYRKTQTCSNAFDILGNYLHIIWSSHLLTRDFVCKKLWIQETVPCWTEPWKGYTSQAAHRLHLKHPPATSVYCCYAPNPSTSGVDFRLPSFTTWP